MNYEIPTQSKQHNTLTAAGAGGAGGATGAASIGGAGGTAGARGPGAVRTRGAAGAGGAGGATRAPGAGGTRAAGAGGAGAAGFAPRQLFFYPQPQSSLPPSDSVLRQPGSSVPAPAPNTEVTESLTKHREPETHASIPVCACRVACPRPHAVPVTHGMALRPSSVPECLVLPEPPASPLPHVPVPESDLARATCPTVNRLLTTVSEPVCPPSIGGEPALSSDVLEDRQFELECLAVALPRFASMLLCPEGDPDAHDIPTLRSNAEAIVGEYSSKWQTAIDAEMTSWKSM
ncbi:unnamed protein product [Closterium sp. NIES-54]